MEPKSKKSVQQLFANKKTGTFLIFLAFSCIIWLMIKLSKEYQQEYDVSLNIYENSKQNIISSKSTTTATVLVRATGFQLLGYSLKFKEFSIDVSNYSTNNVSINLNSNRYKNALQNQLFKRGIVLSANPENLKVTIDKLSEQKITVKPNVQLIFRNGFQLTDSLIVSPEKISVYGPSEFVDSITSITTAYKSIEDIYEDFNYTLKIQPPINKEISYSVDQVTVKGTVERFSEKIYELPVRFINVPADVTIKSFPEQLEVLCKGSLDNLKKLTANDFDLICDYKKIDSTSTYVKTEMRSKPKKIEVVQINDDSFQVLIRKK